ncbi:hypothetical protein ACH9EU_00105 [Kocuria sp. M1R5S2]|uniref:hypothetical protein n=1 Tax=Kocuria rhizosphaerae TaxID=3376285 RepID=UPI0037BB18EB
MTVPFPRSPGRCRLPVGAALLAVALTACAGGGGPDASASPEPAATTAGFPSPASTTHDAGAPSASTAPPGNDVAPYDDTATRDAAAQFGSTQTVSESLDAVVEGPRPATTGDQPVRAAPGTPVQVFTLTLTNTGATPVDALPWSFPVALAGGEPAVPVFDESLGVRMETFPTIAPGESVSLDAAFSAPHDADLAVRVFDNTTPDHYVEFTG